MTAFVSLPGTFGFDDAMEDPAVVALRLLSSLGWAVSVWCPSPVEDRWPLTRLLRSSGIEIVTPTVCSSPAALLADSVDVDVILLDDTSEASLLAQAMALHPRARIVLLARDPNDSTSLGAVAGHLDAILGSVTQPALQPSLDLRGLPPNNGKGTHRRGVEDPGRILYVAGWPDLQTSSSEVSRSRERGWISMRLPLLPLEAQTAGGVVAIRADTSFEVEGVRTALVSGVPTLMTTEVAASVGLGGVKNEGILNTTEEVERAFQALREGKGPGRALGEWGRRYGAAQWPWALAERPFVALLRKAGVRTPPAINQRLTALARETGRSSVTERDVVVLGIIPWRYRFQRPQHFAAELGRRGWRVFYVNPDPLLEKDAPLFMIEESPADNVYSLRLHTSAAADIHAAPPDPSAVRAFGGALRALAEGVGLRTPALLLQAPFWLPVAREIEHSLLAYDCMDLYRELPNARASLVALEDQLFARADVVVFSSTPLQKRIHTSGKSVVIRNACEYKRFADAVPLRVSERPTVGYVGAIDRWFDIGLLERCASSHPDWDFILFGSTAGLPRGVARSRPNVQLRGEVDYEDVPRLVRGFDVCLVPFVDNALTRCVDPVKVYEYLAAGRPVVATGLPELKRLEGRLVHLAFTSEDFLRALDCAMAESKNVELSGLRSLWAARETWEARAEELDRALMGC